ncbi:zinc finger protein, partial [Aphelenchoides avenae]
MPAVATNGCKNAASGATATAISVKGDALKPGRSPQITLKNNQQMTCLSLGDMDCLKTPTVPDLLRTPTTLGSPTKSASCLAHADELNTPGLCFNSCTPKNHGQAFFGENEPLLTANLSANIEISTVVSQTTAQSTQSTTATSTAGSVEAGAVGSSANKDQKTTSTFTIKGSISTNLPVSFGSQSINSP